MIYKRSTLCLLGCLASVMSFAQKHTIYLDKNLLPTAEPTDIACRINAELSRQEILVYNCFNANNELQYQLSGKFFVSTDLIDGDRHLPYLKSVDNESSYLLGHYENGKPLNGFFRHEDENEIGELTFYDFYEKGIRTEQFFNNLFKLVTENWDDNEYTWHSLNEKSVYKNGILLNGFRYTEFKDGGTTMLIEENVAEGKILDFTVGLFAIHFAEFINIKPISNGYVLNYLNSDVSASISYINNERTIKLSQSDSEKSSEFTFYYKKLSDFKIADLKDKETAVYFSKDNEIYVDRLLEGKNILYSDRKEEFGESILKKLTMSFSAMYPELSPEYIFKLFDNENRDHNEILGSISFFEGRYFGIKYESGKNKGFYKVTILEDDEEVIAENKTVNEIKKILTSLTSK